MDPMDRELIKELPDGRKVWNFNPPDATPDSEKVNEGYGIAQFEKGLTYDSAKKSSTSRPEVLHEKMGYQVFRPCCNCTNCVIVREVENGELVNRAYLCKMMKAVVEKYGTCRYALKGKTGPFIITRQPLVEEALARKDELVN